MCQILRLLFWKSPQECQNVTIQICFIIRTFYELRCTVTIEIVWTFYLKSVPAKFQKYLKHISWVISGTSSSTLSCNPRHPSRNISYNHRHHLLQPSWRRIFSTSNNQKTILYIRRRKWGTAGFIRTHQRKYWNALTVGRGHADDGCSCSHRAVPWLQHGYMCTSWGHVTWLFLLGNRCSNHCDVTVRFVTLNSNCTLNQNRQQNIYYHSWETDQN